LQVIRQCSTLKGFRFFYDLEAKLGGGENQASILLEVLPKFRFKYAEERGGLAKVKGLSLFSEIARAEAMWRGREPKMTPKGRSRGRQEIFPSLL
jgi:hypothetical protein